ncbi:variable large family protein [Borrelia crocidurae]|uniref:Variable large protein n=1 Tax=Borrelia crocidurae (strain Achema) TaxID=1155096 RepID=I0FF75_BORCA|nr:variable large family protein [Borrelia crocidurae]AFI32131.1 Vlp protein, alpha subfamily [Borrelia crocidurae str. Achema]
MKIERKKRRVKVVILMVMMVVMMVMGCNSGGVKGEGTGGGEGRGLSGAMMEVGRSAESAFYAFIELMSDTLGLRVNKDTKRNAVGEYFNGLGVKLGEASDELEKVASKATSGVDKSDALKNPIRVVVDAAKEVLSSLKGYLESLKDIGDDTKVGEATSNQNGVAAADGELKKAYKALKGIVDMADKEGVAKPKVGDIAVKVDNADNKDGAKVLAAGTTAGAAVGEKAAAIVSSVSGEEILASIVKSGEVDAAINADVTAGTSALSFAKGSNNAGNLAKEAAKAGAVAGGIALRSLVKDGKLAGHNTNSDEKTVQSAGVSAVNKLLGAVEEIVRKTVKNILEKVKQEVDKARDPKAVGQQ